MGVLLKAVRQPNRRTTFSRSSTTVPAGEVWIAYNEGDDPEDILHGARTALRGLRRLISGTIRQDSAVESATAPLPPEA